MGGPDEFGENTINFLESASALSADWSLKHGTDGGALLRSRRLPNWPTRPKASLRVGKKVVQAIRSLDGASAIGTLLEEVTSPEERRQYIEEIRALRAHAVLVGSGTAEVPTAEKHRTCTRCATNDFVAPGLEFNEAGVCALCQMFDVLSDRRVRDFFPGFANRAIGERQLLEAAKHNPGRFDVMILLTGGKDSSYLLWYAAKKLGLRVLACVWEMPFNAQSANRNIQRCKEKLDTVEFVSRQIPWGQFKRCALDRMRLDGRVCFCPFTAFYLFHPLAYFERIPFVINGIELSQWWAMLVRAYFDGMPAVVERMHRSEVPLLQRLGARLLLRPNLRREFVGSGETEGVPERLLRRHVPGLIDTVVNIGRRGRASRMPRRVLLMKEVERDLTFGSLMSRSVFPPGKEVRETLEQELGWEMPEGQEGLLHTSCQVEALKEYSQLYETRGGGSLASSVMELCAAVNYGATTREAAVEEMKEKGFAKEPAALQIVLNRIGGQMSDCAFYEDRADGATKPRADDVPS